MYIQHKLLMALIAPLCAMALAGCGQRDAGETHSASALPRAAVTAVKTETLANSFSTVGEFMPFQEVELHAKVSGYIKHINVDIGDRVRTGQVLAVLEVPELNAQVQGANATVRHSAEEITRAKNEVSRAEANHAALHAAAMRLAQASKARPGLIAEQELDNATARDRESEAQVEVARSAFSASQQQLEVTRASAQQVSAMQDYSRIVAPFDGVVTWRYADTGSLIQAGTSNSNSQPVVKVAQVKVLRLRVPVPEAFVAGVHNNDTAEVRVQATGEHFDGKVSRSTDSFDRNTRTMQVEIDVTNPCNKLSPGMYAEVSLKMHTQQNTMTIPVQALKREGDKASVLVLDENNTVVNRLIETGVETPDRVQVLSGLRGGERVIVGNLNSFEPGEKVQPKDVVVAMKTGGSY